jgi:pyrroline-5-carboxylate reductase
MVDGLASEADESQSYSLVLTHRRPEAAEKLRHDYPKALVTTDNTDAQIWKSSEHQRKRHIVVIGTQPQFTSDVCDDITRAFTSAGGTQQLVVVTVCPGITISQLESWLPPHMPIVRTMPNTPVAVKQGATALFVNRSTTSEVASEIQSIFQRMSPTVALLPREDLMDIVASVSGYVAQDSFHQSLLCAQANKMTAYRSAPAYFFHLIQSLVSAGAAFGLSPDIGQRLVIQSCLGAARLAQESPDATMPTLLGDVCVAGGSTEKAIRTLDRLDTSAAVLAAVKESWHANQAMANSNPAAKK